MNVGAGGPLRGDVADARHGPDKVPTAAHRAALLLASHPERQWCLRDLAAHVHLSASQLSRLFVREMGVSPMQYLVRVRARRLAQLLVATDLPVGVAMRQVGWGSRGHAARQFQAVTGFSPSAYRKVADRGERRDRPSEGHRSKPPS
ncbi:helix-turn-helix transcriptional regulator [Micrococcus luteus]|nr:helix-turn-helix transcriptional regulator [Micrococcus luteus]